MPSSDTRQTDRIPGAIAIIKVDPPEVLLAENAAVMARLLALRVVAASDPHTFAPDTLQQLRAALLEERWADAVVLWMETFDADIDIYDGYVPVWTEADLEEEFASMEIRVSRIFEG